MLQSWRPLVAAAVFSVIAGAGSAAAQTVIAREVPAGSTVELVLNDKTVATATADASGDARLPFKLPGTGDASATMDAQVHVDVCDALHRILVADRALASPAPEAGCTRKDVLGVFLVRSVTNLVVRTSGPIPTVWLRQGPVDLTARGPSSRFDDVPTGLIAFGGAGLSSFRDALLLLCGNVTPCDGEDSRTTYTAGATFWLSPFIGIEGSYVRPPSVNASGTGTNFSFNSVLDAHVYLIGGKVGIPINRVRIYGQGGTNYHRATQSTTETINDLTISIGGVPLLVPGGSQTIELRTGGWGWQFGAGMEVWVKPSVGIFGEVSRIRLKGGNVEGPEAELEDYLSAALFGLRIKIGR
jgi:hypothetical protein